MKCSQPFTQFIKDATHLLERSRQFTNHQLDPYTTNEIWMRWLKQSNQNVNEQAQLGIQLIQLQIDHHRNINNSYIQLSEYIVTNKHKLDSITLGQYLQLATQTHLNEHAILNAIFNDIQVDTKQPQLNVLSSCADLQCENIELISQLIDATHDSIDSSTITTYLYCLFLLIPPSQSTLLIQLINNKLNVIKQTTITRELQQICVLIHRLYTYNNLQIPSIISEIQQHPIPLVVQKVKQSHLQQQIQILLNMVGIDYQQEHLVQNLYQIDFHLPETNHIIEVNGPYHYVYNIESDNPSILNGRTFIKQMILTALDYQVRNISYLDYYKSKGVTQRLQLLRQLIEQ